MPFWAVETFRNCLNVCFYCFIFSLNIFSIFYNLLSAFFWSYIFIEWWKMRDEWLIFCLDMLELLLAYELLIVKTLEFVVIQCVVWKIISAFCFLRKKSSPYNLIYDFCYLFWIFPKIKYLLMLQPYVSSLECQSLCCVIMPFLWNCNFLIQKVLLYLYIFHKTTIIKFI